MRAASLLCAGLTVLGCGGGGEPPFDPESYLADLAELEALTATAYANLEWALAEGGIDPAELDALARREILSAGGDEGARRALELFVESFGDGHFRLLPPPPPQPAQGSDGGAPGPETPAAEACTRLGYEEHDQSLRLDLGGGFRYVTDPDDPLPAGWLERRDGRLIGLVRIDEFGAKRFGEYCPELWESYRRELDGPCDDWDCEYGFRLAVVDRLLEEIAGRVRRLTAEGVDGLVVDVTGNGGGSDWVDPAARMLSGETLLGNPRSFVRHPHWAGILEQMAGDVARDLGRADLSAEQRAVLEEAAARLATGIAEARRPCDLSPIWRRGGGELPCSLLVRGTLYTTGLLPAPPEIATEGLEIGAGLFKALDYGKRPTVWRGPLAVAIDRGSASATELFAALLRDNEAAILIGERTFGAGCGYTNGGIQARLGHSGLEVWLPDCVRHRRDGGNERAGIAPDLAIAWQPSDGASERGARLLARLEDWAL